MQPLVQGAVVAGYRLGAELGRGTSGVVFRAAPLAGGDDVAIKIMSASFVMRPDARARFMREARVAASFVHPSAVPVLDYGDEDGALFLVMAALSGRSLRARMADGAIEASDIISIGAEVADVLSAAHDVELVHRDIKPENIFLVAGAARPIVRVLDFGLAFFSEHEGSLGRLTQDGVLGGTPAYMSPEQAQAEPLTAATDVYSLGCVLYELVSGEVPFTGGLTDTLARHIFMAPAKLDSPLWDLIGKMLAKPPSARPTPQAVAARLREIQ